MIPRTHAEIEAQIYEIQLKKKKLSDHEEGRVGLGESGFYDRNIYDSKDKFEGYTTSIDVNNETNDNDEYICKKKRRCFEAPHALLKELAKIDHDPFADRRQKTVAEKEYDYRQRHYRIKISPERIDPFADGDKTPANGSRTYKVIMQEQQLKREEKQLFNKVIEKIKGGTFESVMDPGPQARGFCCREKILSLRETDGSMNKKHKRSKSSDCSSSNYTDSDDDSPKRKSHKSGRSTEVKHHRRKYQKNRSEDLSSDDDGRNRSRDREKNGRHKQASAVPAVRVKEEPVSEDERDARYKNRPTEEPAGRSEPRTHREDSHKRPNNLDTKDQNQQSRRHVKDEAESNKEPEWGKKDIKTEKKEPAKNNAKPDFGLSGKLTEDANTFNGVVIKYSEPPEARKPKRRWRLYPFKGEQALPVLHIHRQSAYLLGRDRKVADIPIDHPSCSKQHAALQYRLVPFTRSDGSKGRQIKLYVIDLESANGTYLNNQKVEAKKYYELKERDVVKFGYSSREYVLLHEHSKDSENDDDVNNDD